MRKCTFDRYALDRAYGCDYVFAGATRSDQRRRQDTASSSYFDRRRVGCIFAFPSQQFPRSRTTGVRSKLLLERESARLGVRGGLPITALGGRIREGGISPTAARSFREVPPRLHRRAEQNFTSGYESSVGDEKSSHIEVETTQRLPSYYSC